ncbi:MAG TPA: extracellular solute-binding protein [Chloroflexota bacterium]|nr:extracellular solute-binding protein [Chloroflexota bacterium]
MRRSESGQRGIKGAMTRRRAVDRGLLGLGGAAVLAACGAEGSPTSGGQGGRVAAPAQPTRVEVWHAWSGSRQPLADQIFAKLMQEYPTLTIETVVQGVNGEAGMTKLTAAVAGGTPPDSVMMYQDLIPEYGPGTGVLATLDEYMRRDGVKRDIFYEADINACTAQGKTWMLPHVLPNTYTGLLYNKALTARVGIDLDKNPPASWAEFEEVTGKLTAPQSAPPVLGFVMDIATDRNAEAWWGTQGLAAFSVDGRKATFAEAPNVEVVEWMLRVGQRTAPADALATVMGGKAVGQGTLTDTFTSGQLAVLQTAMYNGYTISQTNPDVNWGVMPVMPRTRGQKMALPHKDAWGFAALQGSKAKDAAWLVVKRMTADEEGGGWLMVQQGRPSPLKKVNDSPEQRKNNPYYGVYKTLLESRWSRPGVWVPVEATRAYREGLKAVATGAAAPRTALQEAAARAQAILDKEAPR